MGNCYIVRKGGVGGSSEQEWDETLPSGYTKLTYVICPSSSSSTGFNLPISLYNGDIIISKTICLTAKDEASIYGYPSVFELYYNNNLNFVKDMSLTILNQDTTVIPNIVSTKFTANNSTINIGYYRKDQYIFNGKIYNIKAGRLASDLTVNKVFNLVPAKRNSDNAIGLYEKVTNTFYTSTTGLAFTSDE